MKSVRLALPVLSFALLVGCAKHPKATVDAAANLPPAKVHLATARIEESPQLIEVTGTVRPVQRAIIAAKVMGAIEEMPFALGQRIKAGDLLVKISAGEISAKVAQAQVQLNMATRDLERERGLLSKNASTSDTVKNLEDRFAMAEAMMREAEVMLGYAAVRAPFDGVVSRKMANAGDLAAPGIPLLEVEGVDVFQVEAGVPESLAAHMTLGTALTVEVSGTDTPLGGRLVELSSAADALARTVQAKISLPADAAVRSGQFARVFVPGRPIRVLFAPSSAVSTLGQMERVFVAQNNRAVLRLVKTGASRGDRIEILSGVAEGESLVQTPPAALREGQVLEVQP
jgi:RND family efflux transporter MFP subunit